MQIWPFPSDTKVRPVGSPFRCRRVIAVHAVLLSALTLGCLGDVDLGDDDSGNDDSGNGDSSDRDLTNSTSAAGSELNQTNTSEATDSSSSMDAGAGVASTSDTGSSMDTSTSPNDDSLMSLLSESNGDGETGAYLGMTEAHNLIRAELDADFPLPPLQWDVELSVFAQQWSDELAIRCGSIEHRVQRNYGENIAIRGSRPNAVTFSPAEAVDGWAAEVACWDFGTIVGRSSSSPSPGQETCDLQCANDLFANGCGHYTQLVWRNSEKVGCGYSTCQSDGWNYGVWVCNYDPPGNFIGREPY